VGYAGAQWQKPADPFFLASLATRQKDEQNSGSITVTYFIALMAGRTKYAA
jgi:hypothetical protein